MIKSLSLQKIDMDVSPAMEYWYYMHHSAQVSRRFGPWLARHESYMPVFSPKEAKPFGLYNWRFVNCYWSSFPVESDGELAFTPPPHTLYCANAFTPAQPTEIFCGQNEKPENHSVLRWIQLIKYPVTISREEGDNWYIHQFAPQALKQKASVPFHQL